MGDLLQFRLRRTQEYRNGDVTPESETFASKCMESLYDTLGYTVISHDLQGARPMVAHQEQSSAAHPEKALHDDICDTIRAYVTEALHPSAARHAVRQERHLHDLTGLVNQLLTRDGIGSSDLLPHELKPLLKQAMSDASLFYFHTNLFPEPVRGR